MRSMLMRAITMLTHITANRNQIIRGQKHFGFHHLEYTSHTVTANASNYTEYSSYL